MTEAKQLEEEDNIIIKWAQEDVETLYSPLNNNSSYLNNEDNRINTFYFIFYTNYS
jgi:hypothetical protein